MTFVLVKITPPKKKQKRRQNNERENSLWYLPDIIVALTCHHMLFRLEKQAGQWKKEVWVRSQEN